MPAASPCLSDRMGEAGAADQGVASGVALLSEEQRWGRGRLAQGRPKTDPGEEHKLPGPPLQPSHRIGRSWEGPLGDHGRTSHVTQCQACLPVPASGQPRTPSLRILGTVRNGSRERPHAPGWSGPLEPLGFTHGVGDRKLLPCPQDKDLAQHRAGSQAGLGLHRLQSDAKMTFKKQFASPFSISFFFSFF